jgi:hypothetical protein
MQNTKWREIIISLLIGIVFGVLLISVGFEFIAKNVETSLVTAVILIIISGLAIIIVYRNRKKAVTMLTGVKEDDIHNIEKSLNVLVETIKKRNFQELGLPVSGLFKIGLLKYSEMAFRTWAFRSFFSLLAIFGGVITAGLLVKQNQLLEDQKNLLSAQNNLIDKENKYLVEINKPRFGIKNSGITVKKSGQEYYFESLVKIENYGKREANSVQILTTVFEVIEEKCRVVFNEELNPVNMIVPDQITDYVQHFKSSSENASQFIKFQISYIDNLSNQKDTLTLFYRIPQARQIFEHPKKELGLFNPEKSEMNKILDCE